MPGALAVCPFSILIQNPPATCFGDAGFSEFLIRKILLFCEDRNGLSGACGLLCPVRLDSVALREDSMNDEKRPRKTPEG
jgi:hypothetical protein